MYNESEDDAKFFAHVAGAIGGAIVAILYVACVCVVVLGQCGARALEKWR